MKNIFVVLLMQLLLVGSLFTTSCSKSDDPVSDNTSPAPIPQRIQSETITVNGVTFDMMLVRAGTFNMGATPEQTSPAENELPVHSVTLTNDYYLGETEVTQGLWRAVMGSNPSSYIDDDKPVEQVSWNDCQEFISHLNSLTGRSFRLPTEAEWEFAARGGNNRHGYQYAGSGNLIEVAWFGDVCTNGTRTAGGKLPNELGLYDMSGNVCEWCQDFFGPYGSDSQTDPTGPTTASYRVCRGGGWSSGAWGCRVAFRDLDTPDHCGNSIGFRLALSE